MSRIRSDEALLALRRRARVVPAASTLAASALAVLPVITTIGLMPPAGLLMLLAWRLLRPELWSAWAGLPLGLADDLLSGAPIGTGPVFWTACLLVLERVESGASGRGWLQEWLLAAGLIAACLTGGWIVGALTGGGTRTAALLPQYLVTLATFPLAMRVAAALDRWRLGR